MFLEMLKQKVDSVHILKYKLEQASSAKSDRQLNKQKKVHTIRSLLTLIILVVNCSDFLFSRTAFRLAGTEALPRSQKMQSPKVQT